MLDSTLKTQLQAVFEKLENPVELVIRHTDHPDLNELTALLDDVASTSPLISTVQSAEVSDAPEFFINYKGQANGIEFRGIPGGHEFTSLILAILNSDQKGKLPDRVLTERIRKIKKNITVRTFMSLTCENCPEVVQALNQIAILHGSMKHIVIDGAYSQVEIERLGIQGVPSLVANDKMFHSGRITLLDLVAKLESVFGIDESAQNLSDAVIGPTDLGHFDVLVVGGGPAGVSAAIYSVRKGLKTAIITDKIGGQVQETKGIENLISVPYTEGPQLAAQLGAHLTSYPVELLENRRVRKISRDGQKKRVELESNEVLHASAVIVTTGAKWRELNIPGEKEYIGRGVAFCPHCDGPFYKGKKVAVIGGGNSGVEAALDLAGIVKEVVLIEYNDNLKADKILVDKLLSTQNISVLTSARTQRFIGDEQKVNTLEYLDRTSNQTVLLPVDGVFIQIGLVPNSQFLKGVVDLTSFGEIIVDEKGRTSEFGIYAAGDVTTTPYKQIIIAMGEGAKAALAAFEDRMMGKHVKEEAPRAAGLSAARATV